jgi:uncharacterized membrane protein
VSTVTKSVDVDVPVETAYNQWTQFETFPEFLGGVEQIQQLDDRHTHWKVNIKGIKREFDAEITEQQPDQRVAWKSTDGTTHAGVVTFHKLAPEQTRVTVQLDWEPGNVLENAAEALNVDEHQVQSDLERFKKFIEQRGTESGAWRGEIPREG